MELDYGAWDGLTADECRKRDPDLRAAWEADPYETRCPDGESGADVGPPRLRGSSRRSKTWLAADRARCAIVVAHNHVIRLRLCALLGWPLSEYRPSPVGRSRGIQPRDTRGRSAPVVRRVNAPAA